MWNSIAPAFQSLLSTHGGGGGGGGLNHQGQNAQLLVESAKLPRGAQPEPEPNWHQTTGVEWAGSCTCDCNGEGFGEGTQRDTERQPLLPSVLLLPYSHWAQLTAAGVALASHGRPLLQYSVWRHASATEACGSREAT